MPRLHLLHTGPRVGQEAVAVRHPDQRQGLRVHDVLLADDAVAVEEVGGHRVHLVGREGVEAKAGTVTEEAITTVTVEMSRKEAGAGI